MYHSITFANRIAIAEETARLVDSPIHPAPMPNFRRLLDGFLPIGLIERDSVALLNWTDVMYVLGASQMAAAPESLTGADRVPEVDGFS